MNPKRFYVANDFSMPLGKIYTTKILSTWPDVTLKQNKFINLFENIVIVKKLRV